MWRQNIIIGFKLLINLPSQKQSPLVQIVTRITNKKNSIYYIILNSYIIFYYLQMRWDKMTTLLNPLNTKLVTIVWLEMVISPPIMLLYTFFFWSKCCYILIHAFSTENNCFFPGSMNLELGPKSNSYEPNTQPKILLAPWNWIPHRFLTNFRSGL